MGLSLKKLGKSIYETLTPQNEGALRRAQASQAAAQQRIMSLGNRSKGVLGSAPARQQFVQQNRAPRFSLAKAARDTISNPRSWETAPKINVGNFRGSGIAEDFLNFGFEVGKGGAKIGQGRYKEGLGDVATGLIEGPAGLLPVTRAAQAGVKGAGLLPKVLSGAKRGAIEGGAYSGAYGAGSAAQQNLSNKDIAKQAAISGGIGVVGGGVLGGGLPVAGAGARAVQRYDQAQNQIGAVGKNVSPALPPATTKTLPTPVKPVAKPAGQGTNEQMNAAVKSQAERYKASSLGRAKNATARFFDPFAELVRIDKSYAKSKGIKYKDLPASERTDYLAERSIYSSRQADQLLKNPNRSGQSVAKVIQKYGEATPAGKEFNNYLNARFAVEVNQKRGIDMVPGQNRQQLETFVRDYEARNPSAVADATTIKQHGDDLLDIGVREGVISKADADFVKTYYKNYVPLSRVFPEDLERVDIGGRSVGSIGRQGILQRIEASPTREAPLDNSFSTIVGRTKGAVTQANRAALARRILERSKQGVVKDSELLVGAGNKATRKEVRADVKTVDRSTRFLAKKLSLTSRQARRLETELNNLNKKGVEARLKNTKEPNLAGKLVDPTASVSPNEMRSIVQNLVNVDPTGLSIIKNKIATREPKLADKLDQILAHKKEIASNKSLKQELKGVIAQFADDPTTGKQTISGLIDGQPFKLEVSPELARVLQGMDEAKLNAVVSGMSKGMKVFQTAWTGFLNPIFSMISFAFYDAPMTVINSKLGLRTFGARPMAEMFRSVRQSNGFQKALAENGAQLVGASLLPRDVKLSATAIAAQKDYLSKLRFGVRHPSQILEQLDTLGGKLQNATRTRVAKAHYINSKKQGMTEAQARAEAAYYYNNVMPNFGRTSALAKQLNAFIPYVTASVAGTRALMTGLRNNPANVAKLAGVAVAPMVGTIAYSLASKEGNEYVEDMIASKREYQLDNNLNIVLPGASKDPETGKWTGVFKVPLPPELRALNQVAWRGTYDFVHGDINKANPPRVAGSLFDFMSGGIRTSDNPFVDMGKIALNKDPRTGEDIVRGRLADKPKAEQVYDSTTGAGKKLASLTGNRISPIQGDKMLGQLGFAGQLTQNREGNPLATTTAVIKNRFTGAYGQTQQQKDYLASKKESQAETRRRDDFKKSDASTRIDGNIVYRKSASGDVYKMTKDEYDYSLNSAKLTQYKNKGDLNSWLATADKQLAIINRQLRDPNLDELDKTALQNRARAVLDSVTKYQGYGGFKKPKVARRGSRASVGSAYKYAVSPGAGGKSAKPKVTITAGKGKAKKRYAVAKPKVSIKKSLV